MTKLELSKTLILCIIALTLVLQYISFIIPGLAQASHALISSDQQLAPLKSVQEITLPGTQGRLDHMAFDALNQRLFLAALENNTLEVVDARLGMRIKSVGGLYHPQGLTLVPEKSRLFVACGDGTVNIFNSSSLELVRRITLGKDADNVRYDAFTGEVYVGYGDGALAVLSSEDGTILDRINLSGHPEAFEIDALGKRIFINVPSARHIAVADRARRILVENWSVTNASDNFPMALNKAEGELLVGCWMPPKLLIYDTATGRQVAALDIDGDADDIFYDTVSQRIYISCGQGFIDVLKRTGKDRYQLESRTNTSKGARTSLLVPEVSKLYVSAPKSDGVDAKIMVFAREP